MFVILLIYAKKTKNKNKNLGVVNCPKIETLMRVLMSYLISSVAFLLKKSRLSKFVKNNPKRVIQIHVTS